MATGNPETNQLAYHEIQESRSHPRQPQSRLHLQPNASFPWADSPKGWTAIKQKEVQDFHTLISFLDSASKGISMNKLTFQKQTQIYRSDSSEFGLGGYNITSGVSW